ncbi:ribosome-inactivating protein bryodin II [Prunus yedoensis var. nudiflora]|uniref:rRNA N-glycosylase n=1 Tax=Prunus yedoensis var. nudiflora TaxID=2094558 RepID=A0A314ZCQ4_PRUYE|nr:ribosome-inactivating protein bryodin II [Prunus yedoensis var. nudiflora]
MVLPFSTRNATPHAYSDFIEALRNRLTARGRTISHGIQVLPRIQDVPDEHRFVLVDLTNSDNNTIRVAIDVVNAYVVGYAAGGRSYFLQENAPGNPPPIHTLFLDNDIIRMPTLNFNGTYGGLAGAAQDAVQRNTPRDRARNRAGAKIHANTPILQRIPLGRNELDNAISLLRYAVSQSDQAVGFIVIIQMLSEAARFRAIEGLVRTTMREDYDPLIRGPAMESLETHWSDLSEEIQRVPEDETLFRNNRTIVLHNIRNDRVQVNSVDSPFVRGVAILLYDRHQNQNQNRNRNCNPVRVPGRRRPDHDEI